MLWIQPTKLSCLTAAAEGPRRARTRTSGSPAGCTGCWSGRRRSGCWRRGRPAPSWCVWVGACPAVGCCRCASPPPPSLRQSPCATSWWRAARPASGCSALATSRSTTPRSPIWSPTTRCPIVLTDTSLGLYRRSGPELCDPAPKGISDFDLGPVPKQKLANFVQ